VGFRGVENPRISPIIQCHKTTFMSSNLWRKHALLSYNTTPACTGSVQVKLRAKYTAVTTARSLKHALTGATGAALGCWRLLEICLKQITHSKGQHDQADDVPLEADRDKLEAPAGRWSQTVSLVDKFDLGDECYSFVFTKIPSARWHPSEKPRIKEHCKIKITWGNARSHTACSEPSGLEAARNMVSLFIVLWL
jgi:hypothetical protein